MKKLSQKAGESEGVRGFHGLWATHVKAGRSARGRVGRDGIQCDQQEHQLIGAPFSPR